MNYFDANLRLLKRRYPDLARRMKGVTPSRNLQVELAKSSYPTIIYRGINKDKLYLHSPYDPVKEAQAVLKNAANDDSQVNIVYGTGLGYHILEILNSSQRGRINIVVEPDLELLRVFLDTSVAGFVLELGNFHLVAGEMAEVNKQFSRLIAASEVNFRVKNLAFYMLPGYARVYGRVYREIQRKILDECRLRYTQYGNSAEDTLIGLKNSFINLKYMVENPGLNVLRGKYQGVPAVIISAGPSLNKNIHLLSQIKGRALLLCVDTVLKKVLDMGVVPDLVLTVERGKIVYDYFYRDLQVPKELYFAGLNVVDPNIYQKFGEKALVGFRGTEPLSVWINNLVKDKGDVNAGLSVANLSFSVARLMGADPIVFMGQDLAYSESGDSHVNGTAYDGTRLSEPIVYVSDYQGKPIPSRDIWKKFLTWFEQEIAAAPGGTYIDATEGGAYIAGTRVMKLEDAIKEHMTGTSFPPVGEVVQEALGQQENISYDEVRTGIEQMVKTIEDLTRDIEGRVYNGISRLKARLDSGVEFDSLKPGLKKVQDDFNLIVSSLNSFPRNVLGFITQSVFVMTVTRLNEIGAIDSIDKIKKIINILTKYYNFMLEIVEIVKFMLEEIVEEIERLKKGEDDREAGAA